MHADLGCTHVGDLELRALVGTAHILNRCCQRRERKRPRHGSYALKHLPAREGTHSGISPRMNVFRSNAFLTLPRCPSRTRPGAWHSVNGEASRERAATWGHGGSAFCRIDPTYMTRCGSAETVPLPGGGRRLAFERRRGTVSRSAAT